MIDAPIFAMIEDDPMCRVVVRKQLEGNSIPVNVVEFDNGHTALKHMLDAIRDNKPMPDVIFLDLYMPVMDGWEFLSYISDRAHLLSTVPQIYILTSSSDPAERQRAEAFHLVKGFIVKPIKLRLVEMILNESCSAFNERRAREAEAKA